ncbi:MAG TPA: DUF5686 and carboxypeptidase regulatory-like domain-containing protein [Bacteroidia bacterium]|jgi:hypothetical protein|nr:DUF5686 and carboxypeptidase regulatory-like domain-containing protein [Bacteroidia bacterium]
MLKKLFLSFCLLLTAYCLPSYAGVIKGVIRDSTGEGIPYSVVVVKNSTYGANANVAGGYFIELQKGTYVLVFSAVSYTSVEKTVIVGDNDVQVIDVTLPSASRTMATFVVTAKGDRDRGKEIMKLVIDHREQYLDKIQNYKCNTYQKTSLERILIKQPDSAIVKIAPPPPPDTTKKKKNKTSKNALEDELKDKQLNLIESYSQTYYSAPSKFKEVILAYHDFADEKHFDGAGGAQEGLEYGEHEIAPPSGYSENPYLLISDAASMDFNFYRNQIDAPALCQRPLLSPLASTAFLNYRFELLDSFPEGNKMIYKLSVTPFYKSDALFSGLIFVEKDSWAVTSVNLNVNKDVLYFCKDFCVVQDYEEVDTGVFLPVRREFTYTIHDGKYNIIGNTRVDQSAYEVNTTLPLKIFNDEIKHYNDSAFDRDSLYWVDHRTIQLDDKEINYIHVVDSLENYYTSPEYYATIDSAFNHINVWSFLLNGVGHRNRVNGTEIFFDPLIADCVPLGVGGYRQKLGGHFNKDFKSNGYLLETDGQIDYGFLNHDVRGKVGVGLTYIPLRFVRTFVRFGDYYDQVNNYASLEQVFARSNYVRTKQFSIAQRMEIVNGLFGEVTFEYCDQAPITGMKLEQWSTLLFDSLNTPTDFQEYIKSEVRFELKYRFKQKYIIKQHKKIIIGTKYPEIRFFYRKGIPGLFNSEINFDYIELGSQDEMQFGRWGTSDWNVLFGSFLNKKDLRLLEYKYFRGSDAFLFGDPMRSFQLLGPTLSTANTFFRLNYIHHFEGAFGSKIPLYGKLKITSAVGGGVLMIPDKDFYHEEFYVGFERIIRIKKQLFRLGVFGVTADSNITKAALTWKVGISYYDTMTRKWSY